MAKTDVAYREITIVKGDDYSLLFARTLKDCATGVRTPVDLSGVASVEAKLLNTNNAALATFTAAVTDATAGEITISLTDDQTALLEGSKTNKVTERIGNYYVRLIWASGLKETILRGSASLISVEGA